MPDDFLTTYAEPALNDVLGRIGVDVVVDETVEIRSGSLYRVETGEEQDALLSLFPRNFEIFRIDFVGEIAFCHDAGDAPGRAEDIPALNAAVAAANVSSIHGGRIIAHGLATCSGFSTPQAG